MNLEPWKNKSLLLTRLLLALCALLILMICFKLLVFIAHSVTLPAAVAKTLARSEPNEHVIKEYTKARKQLSEDLKSKNPFALIGSEPKAPECRGILGNKAFIEDKWYGVGETAAGAKIVAITAEAATVQWQGKQLQLAPIQATLPPEPQKLATPAGSPRPEQVAQAQPTPGETEPVRPEGPEPRDRPGRRGSFRGMSREEMGQMMQRVRNMSPEERRSYFEQMRGTSGSE
jgi:hypothetical protein